MSDKIIQVTVSKLKRSNQEINVNLLSVYYINVMIRFTIIIIIIRASKNKEKLDRKHIIVININSNLNITRKGIDKELMHECQAKGQKE